MFPKQPKRVYRRLKHDVFANVVGIYIRYILLEEEYRTIFKIFRNEIWRAQYIIINIPIYTYTCTRDTCMVTAWSTPVIRSNFLYETIGPADVYIYIYTV